MGVFLFFVFYGFLSLSVFLDKIKRVGIIGDDVCWRVVVAVRIVFLSDRGKERGEVHRVFSDEWRWERRHVVLVQRIDYVDLVHVVGPVELWDLQIELLVILFIIEVDFILKPLRVFFQLLGESFHVEGAQQIGSVVVANVKEVLVVYITPNLRKRLRAHRWSHDVNHGLRVLLRLFVIALGRFIQNTRFGLQFFSKKSKFLVSI